MDGRYILPAAEDLEPLRQGALSATCGLYSCLNALQLALFPRQLRRSELQALYVEGIDHLAKIRQLKRILGAGMYQETWEGLAHGLLARANATYGTDLALKPTLSPWTAQQRGRSIAKIKAEVARGRPVLLNLGGLLRHYTVISGYSTGRLILFDSSEFHWVNEGSVAVGAGSERLHWIAQETTFSVVDEW